MVYGTDVQYHPHSDLKWFVKTPQELHEKSHPRWANPNDSDMFMRNEG